MINDNIKLDTILIDTTFLAPNAPPAGVKLYSNPRDTGYILECTDFVANDWREEFKTLSSALARLALLAYCAGEGWVPTFTNAPEVFSVDWNEFAEKQVN